MTFIFKKIEENLAIVEQIRTFNVILHKLKIIRTEEMYQLDADLPYYDSWSDYYDYWDDYYGAKSEEDDSDYHNRIETDEETSRDRKIRKRTKHKTQYEKIC